MGRRVDPCVQALTGVFVRFTTVLQCLALRPPRGCSSYHRQRNFDGSATGTASAAAAAGENTFDSAASVGELPMRNNAFHLHTDSCLS